MYGINYQQSVYMLVSLSFFYLYEVIGPGREDLSGQWSVWCSHLLKTMRWVYKKSNSNKKNLYYIFKTNKNLGL